MALDIYSLCPGGRNEKIKFCCPDLVKELDELDTMLAGKQASAALSLIERLEVTRPDCACLAVKKCVAYQMLEKYAEFCAEASKLAAREPENQLAQVLLGEAALLQKDEKSALSILSGLMQGITAEQMPAPNLELAGQIALRCMEIGKIYIALPLVRMILAFLPDEKLPGQLFNKCISDTEIPLLFRDMIFFKHLPSDCPDIQKLSQMNEKVFLGSWKEAIRLGEELIPTVADAFPELLRGLGTLHLWLCQEEQSLDYFQRCLEHPHADEMTKIEVARLLHFARTGCYWDEFVTLKYVIIPIQDDNSAVEQLLSSTQLMPFDASRLNLPPGAPRPRNCFHLLDRPLPPKGEVPTVENTPLSLGVICLFGKQMDRSARLELFGLSEEKQEKALSCLRSILGDNVGTVEQDVPIATSNWTDQHLEYQPVLRPENNTLEVNSRLIEDYQLNCFCHDWCHHPMTMLDGKTPVEAAQDLQGVMPIKLQAAMTLFNDVTMENQSWRQITNKIRAILNFPTEPSIQVAVDESGAVVPTEFERLSLLQWSYVDLTKIKSADLAQVASMATLFSAQGLVERIAREIISRPVESCRPEERFFAYRSVFEVLCSYAHHQEALELTFQAQQEGITPVRSQGFWKVKQIPLLYILGQAAGCQQVISDLLQNHQQEQEVMQELYTLLTQMGLIQPHAQQGAAGPFDALLSGGSMPRGASPSSESSSGLWTPDSDNPPSAGSSGGSKLWIPD